METIWNLHGEEIIIWVLYFGLLVAAFAIGVLFHALLYNGAAAELKFLQDRSMLILEAVDDPRVTTDMLPVIIYLIFNPAQLSDADLERARNMAKEIFEEETIGVEADREISGSQVSYVRLNWVLNVIQETMDADNHSSDEAQDALEDCLDAIRIAPRIDELKKAIDDTNDG